MVIDYYLHLVPLEPSAGQKPQDVTMRQYREQLGERPTHHVTLALQNHIGQHIQSQSRGIDRLSELIESMSLPGIYALSR